MDRKTRWRTFWLSLLTALAICVLTPSLAPDDSLPSWFEKLFQKRIQFGLDLQGGLYIVYSIDLNKAIDDKASELKRDLEAHLDEKGIEGKVSTPAVPVGAVTIRLDKPDDKAKIDSSFLSVYGEVIDMRTCPADEDTTTAVCIKVASDYAEGIRSDALNQAILTIRERIDAKGIAEPSVKRKGYQIIVELPGIDDEVIERVKDIIARTAKLEFKMVDNSSDGKLGDKDRNGSGFMKRLYNKVEGDDTKPGDARAKELKITGRVDIWSHEEKGVNRDYYLIASDYTDWLPIEDAKKRGCYNRNKKRFQGQVQCLITGRERIENYLLEIAAADPKLKIDDDHEIGFEYVRPERIADEEAREPYWRTYYLTRPVELSGAAIQTSYVFFDPQSNRPAVLVDFNRYGGRRFGDMTTKNVGRKMAIILDTKIISAPVIQTSITGGRSTITMGGASQDAVMQEAQDLVAGLKTGSLPAPLQEESSNRIGPLLGQDAVDKAKFAFILGSVLVVLLMVWVYRTAGVISIFALSLNIMFMMSVLTTFGATLTLPGIAAIVLTVGMAVDANIIIYERVREELRAGKSIRGAVDAGFSRGFAAIFDGQLTTAAAGYVLMQYGSGPIRGFAVMLIIGIVCTLFTATWCTRLFFEYYVGKGRKVQQIGI